MMYTRIVLYCIKKYGVTFVDEMGSLAVFVENHANVDGRRCKEGAQGIICHSRTLAIIHLVQY